MSVVINTFLIGVLGEAAACPYTPGITAGLSFIGIVCALTFRQVTGCGNGCVDTLFLCFLQLHMENMQLKEVWTRKAGYCLFTHLFTQHLFTWHLFTWHLFTWNCLHDIVYTTFVYMTFVYMTLFTQHLFTQHLITLGRSLSTAMFRSDTSPMIFCLE